MKAVLAVNAFLPLALLGVDAYRGALGANPIEYFLRATGVLTLICLLLTLSITPLRRLTGWNSATKYRRMLGLFAFFYGVVHLVTYSVFDKSLSAELIWIDILQRPFIALGMLAFSLMIPLAVTSTNSWIKRLGGKNWARLHMLVYLSAALGVIHFWMIVKSDVFYPAVLGAVLASLFLFRAIDRMRRRTSIKGGVAAQGLRPE